MLTDQKIANLSRETETLIRYGSTRLEGEKAFQHAYLSTVLETAWPLCILNFEFITVAERQMVSY